MESDRPLRFWGTAGQTLVGLLIASPFLASGVLAILYEQFEGWGPVTMLAAGVLVFAGTLYFRVEGPRPRPDEEDGEVLVQRYPSMKPAFALIVTSLPLFVISGGLLEFTYLPYIWPLIPYLIGLLLCSLGIARFWINHLTVYYVTSKYIVRSYQFFPGVEKGRDTIAIDPVNNSTKVKRSLFQLVTGRGTVVILSSVHQLDMEDIDNPREVERVVKRALEASIHR